jgi:uncharacterized membrane protein YbhN (UPF0104 family)
MNQLSDMMKMSRLKLHVRKLVSIKSLIEYVRQLLSTSKLSVLGQFIFIGLCSYFLVRRIAGEWSEVRLFLIRLEWLRLANPFLLLAFAFMYFPLGAVIFTRSNTQRISYLQSARAFFGSQFTKYLPGSLWVFPSRVLLWRKEGFSLSVSSAALLFEMITLAFSSAIVSACFIGVSGTEAGWGRVVVITSVLGGLIAIVLFVLSPELTQRFLRVSVPMPKVLFQMACIPILVRLKNLVLASITYSGMWILMGMSFFLLVKAVDPAIDANLMPISIGVFPLSWLIGYLSFFSPGGIGVRESMIVVLLSAVISEPYPIMAALISRVIWLIVEGLFGFCVWFFARSELHRGTAV